MKVHGPNCLSKCPESREMDFGHFRETDFSTCFFNFGIRYWTPQARGTGLLRLGNPQAATGGTLRADLMYQPFKKLYKNPLGKPS